MKALIFLFWWYTGVALFAADIADIDPPVPDLIGTEALIKSWTEKAVFDCPPPGGIVTMVKHWTPHYAKNDKVGEIWIIPALMKIEQSSGFDHEMAFVVYHVDTKATDVEVLFAVPEIEVPKYLAEPGQKSI
jgi:hypothetical protein